MKAVKWLNRHAEEVVLVAMLILMLLIEVAQILMRRVVGSSLSWAEEVVRYLFVWSGFLSISFTIQNQSAMRLTILGCQGPYPEAGGACSAYLVEAGGKRVLMEAGSGCLARLGGMMALEALDAVVLSHLHFDHMGEMPLLGYALQGCGKLPVPAGEAGQHGAARRADDAFFAGTASSTGGGRHAGGGRQAAVLYGRYQPIPRYGGGL